MTKTLQVIAKTESFRRAGFVFGSQPTFLKVSDLTPEQIETLKDEPKLVVVELSGDSTHASIHDNAGTIAALKDAEDRAVAAEKKANGLAEKLKAAEARAAAAEKTAKDATAETKAAVARAEAAEKKAAEATVK